MPDKELRSSVSELKSHLDRNTQVPDEDKQALEALASRIELMMVQDREQWEENLLDELEKRVILYEEDHPVVARVIRQIITTLNSMGL
jgi:hypothetical protein